MSDCGFCLNDYEGDSGSVYFGSKVVHSRKDRQCEECGKIVLRKTPIVYHRGKDDGMWQSYVCPVCEEIAQAFYCGNYRIFGSLWDALSEQMEALDTGCFSRLQTADAKRELQSRWIKWKFDTYTMRQARNRVASLLERARKEIGRAA